MSIQSRSSLKNTFITGAKPTQLNFSNLFDSYWHMNDGVATQDWTNNNFVQVNPPAAQDVGFHINGRGRMGELFLDNGNVSAPDIIHFGTSGMASIYRSAGGLDMNYNGFYHVFAGLSLSIPNGTSDPAYAPGGMFFNSSAGKFRGCNGGVWSNMAMEDWATGNFIQNQHSIAETKNWQINGSGSVYGSMSNQISVRFLEEGVPFQSAWYHVISPRGSFSGYNDGGNVYLEPTAYTAANSFVNRRRSYEDPLAYYDGLIRDMNPGLRNGHERIGYESIMLSETIWSQSKAGAFFAAVSDVDAPLGQCYLIGSEHVIKNTAANFSAAAQIMIGMRAVADLNTNGGGINAAGYFKATNAGTTPVHAIYSEKGKNYLKDGVETEQPSANGAGVWKLGKPVAGIVNTDNTKYVEVMIDGQIVKLMTAQ